MNICILTSEYHTEDYRSGGISRHVPKVAHWLASQGHRVHVLVPAWGDQRFTEALGLEVVRFLRCPARLTSSWGKIPQILQFMLESVVAARAVRRQHEQTPFDVIHVFGPSMAWWLLKKSPAPVLLRVPGDHWGYLRANFRPPRLVNWVAGRIEASTIRRALTVYTSSLCTAKAMEKITGRPLHVVRTPMFRIEQEDEASDAVSWPGDFVLFCSGLMGCKGADLAAQAMANVMPDFPDLHFVVIGRNDRAPDGPSMELYMKRILSACISRVRFMGIVSHPTLQDAMRRARFIMAPSRLDNLPNILLEAMYEGQVVIGGRGASFDEILDDGVDGLLVDTQNADALESSIRQAMTLTHEERQAMGARAREKAERLFAPNLVMNEILSLYKESISAFAAGRSN